MTIAKPAVLAFYADSKYVKFSQIIDTHPKPKCEKICQIFEKKRGSIPKKASVHIDNSFFRYIISENATVEVSSSSLQNVEFRFFFHKKHRRCVFICFVEVLQCI